MIDRGQMDWYKDAIIYQTHVKAFYDSNGDGIGDLQGLAEKLDYIADLGATAIWILPFYPSPLRDDGYDIADYANVNSSYGTLDDFRRLIDAAHDRDLRIITELVINHTSDQHAWFQRARQSPEGSRERDFYVWSQDSTKFSGARIIFLDSETSNWTWDPVAKAYYWHRFFHHQPDLNFDNPDVLDAVLAVLHHWFGMGVDGLRLDAVPYLIEREGTNNENLPETHAILKRIRREVDARYPDRMLLAEANQWPEDTAEYFGEGDECHMAFHFPLMPRMYMAVAQEDRHPLTDIMRQTPELPDAAQWAIFLRNHDELTLEMVTHEERDYLWRTYAEDARMRINLGIRRRLAPLLGNDRRKIELMNGLLLSMPGTPVLYYGDELGMGDNIYLGDRDGVRTPMQWSPDRNGGFSRSDPQRLYSQPIMDAIYGYQVVNVEAQARNPASLLNWMRRALAIRKRHRAFGRGELDFLYPANRRILAYLRRHEDEVILCVANLSAKAQSAELLLGEFEGYVPVELSGREPFPPIGTLPYLLTLPGYGFYWFRLTEEAELPSWHDPLPERIPELETAVLRKGETRLDEGAARRTLEELSLPAFLPNQRWYPDKAARIRRTAITDVAQLTSNGRDIHLLVVEVESTSGTHRYFAPLSTLAQGELGAVAPFAVAKLRRAAEVRPLYDALADDSLARAAFAAMKGEERYGLVRFRATSALAEAEIAPDADIARLIGEQSNSSVRIGDAYILKGLRKIEAGIHPEIEITRFLTETARYANAPALLGWAELTDEAGAPPTALMVLHQFVGNQGDAWTRFSDTLVRRLEALSLERADGEQATAPPEPVHDPFTTLGRRIGELHVALRTPTEDPAFKAEPITREDLLRWQRSARGFADAALAAAGDAASGALAAERATIASIIDSLPRLSPEGVKTRIHGDLHLGQLIVVKDDFYVLDMEGEPGRSLEDRRRKTSPWRDVAGMLRSFDYAAAFAMRQACDAGLVDPDTAQAESRRWHEEAVTRFMEGYLAAIGTKGAGDFDRALLRFFTLEKALYEIVYEANNRPAWLDIPLGGALDLLTRGAP